MYFGGGLFKDNGWLNILGVWGMILLSTFIGWLNQNADFPDDSVWSGAAGVAISRVLQNITGIGSIFILSVLMLVTLLLLWDRDLQKTIDNVKIWMENMREKMEESRIAREEKKAQRIAEREERIAEKKAELALKKEEKESEKAEKDRNAKIKKRQIAEAKTKEEAVKPTPSIDEIVEKSEEEDRKRIEEEKAAVKTLDTRQRAVLEKKEEISEEEAEDDVEVAIFKGEGDEEAGEKDLDKINEDKAKEVPVIKYKFPTIDLLTAPPNEGNEVDLEEIKENKRIILDKLKRHKLRLWVSMRLLVQRLPCTNWNLLLM